MPIHLEKGKPRTLAYGTPLREDLKLLEVTEELLQELQEHGLTFKGAEDEEAVLCSANHTYAVKKVETSNLVLLMDAASEPPPPSPAFTATPSAAVAAAAAATTHVGSLPGLATQRVKDSAASEQAPVTASAIVGSHLELVKAAPRLQALDAILSDRPYGGEDLSAPNTHSLTQDFKGHNSSTIGGGGERPPPGRTWEELQAAVQASSAEIAMALQERGAVKIDGRWRGVDAGYLGTLLELLLLTAVEHGWELNAIPAERAADALELHGYPRRLTFHCLGRFGKEEEGGVVSAGSGSSAAAAAAAAVEGNTGTAAATYDGAEGAATRMETEQREHGSTNSYYSKSHLEPQETTFTRPVAMQEAAVCRHFGMSILIEQPLWKTVEEFLAAWQAAVPESMTPAVEMLQGEALLDNPDSSEGGLRAFSVRDLPWDAGGRFTALFTQKPHWQLEEMEPYLEGLAGPGETTETLLLKYARASQKKPTDPVTYSAR